MKKSAITELLKLDDPLSYKKYLNISNDEVIDIIRTLVWGVISQEQLQITESYLRNDTLTIESKHIAKKTLISLCRNISMNQKNTDDFKRKPDISFTHSDEVSIILEYFILEAFLRDITLSSIQFYKAPAAFELRKIDMFMQVGPIRIATKVTTGNLGRKVVGIQKSFFKNHMSKSSKEKRHKLFFPKKTQTDYGTKFIPDTICIVNIQGTIYDSIKEKYNYNKAGNILQNAYNSWSQEGFQTSPLNYLAGNLQDEFKTIASKIPDILTQYLPNLENIGTSRDYSSFCKIKRYGVKYSAHKNYIDLYYLEEESYYPLFTLRLFITTELLKKISQFM